MSVPAISAPAVNVAAAAQSAPPPRPAQSAATPPPQGAAHQPAATVTISDEAKEAANASHQHSQHKPVSAPAQQTTNSPQTSASSYVAKVRAALTSNPSLTLSQALSAAGVPQAEQQQVSAALGSAKETNA